MLFRGSVDLISKCHKPIFSRVQISRLWSAQAGDRLWSTSSANRRRFIFFGNHLCFLLTIQKKGEVKIRQEKQIVDHRHPIPVATRSQYAVTMQEIKSKFKFFHLDRPLSTTANEWALSVTCGRKIDRCRCPLATFNNYTQLDCLLFGSQSSIQFQSVSQASESSQGSLKS